MRRAKEDFEKFVEDGKEDGHFGFSGGGEDLGEGFQARVMWACSQGRHEEDFAQVAAMEPAIWWHRAVTHLGLHVVPVGAVIALGSTSLPPTPATE